MRITELVAKGLEIEARLRPEALKRRRLGSRNPQDETRQTRWQQRRNETGFLAAQEMGVGESTYWRAKQVVAAAEKDPARFGDLLEAETVSGAYDEMKSRRRGSTPQSFVTRRGLSRSGGRPRHSGDELAMRIFNSLEPTVKTLEQLDPTSLDPSQRTHWAETYRMLGRRLQHVARRMQP